MSGLPEVIVWTDASRVSIVRELLQHMAGKVQCIGIGGPRSGELEQLAGELELSTLDDLRQLIIDKPAAYVMLATMQDVSPDDVIAAMNGGSLVLALEPVAADHSDISRLHPRIAPEGRYELSPAFLRGAGWHSAADPLDVLGEIKLINFTSFARPNTQSLFAQLVDAWQVILHFAPLPYTIDASLGGPLQRAPEDPRGLTGHLTAHARLANGSACTLQISDMAASRTRRLDVVGKTGLIFVNDDHYRLYEEEGSTLDSNPHEPEPPGFAHLIAEDWQQLMREPLGSSPRPDAKLEASTLTCALACLLSARTGQPESPEKLLEIQA